MESVGGIVTGDWIFQWENKSPVGIFSVGLHARIGMTDLDLPAMVTAHFGQIMCDFVEIIKDQMTRRGGLLEFKW